MDSATPSPELASPALTQRYTQIHLKSEGEKLLLILPNTPPKDAKQTSHTAEATSVPVSSSEWPEMIERLKYYLKNSDRFWQESTLVHLLAQDRLLDTRQLQSLSEALQEADLELTSIQTSRRQTAVAAATAGYCVEQIHSAPSLSFQTPSERSPLAEPLYLKNTIRSGIEIRHLGSVIVMGDINPGGAVIAAGDILVWGCLRGVAHAGTQGNKEAVIMALRMMEPAQLRIADLVARVPSNSPQQAEPEVAYVSNEGIRITQAYNFSKTYAFNDKGGWVEKDR